MYNCILKSDFKSPFSKQETGNSMFESSELQKAEIAGSRFSCEH